MCHIMAPRNAQFGLIWPTLLYSTSHIVCYNAVDLICERIYRYHLNAKTDLCVPDRSKPKAGAVRLPVCLPRRGFSVRERRCVILHPYPLLRLTVSTPPDHCTVHDQYCQRLLNGTPYAAEQEVEGVASPEGRRPHVQSCAQSRYPAAFVRESAAASSWVDWEIADANVGSRTKARA